MSSQYSNDFHSFLCLHNVLTIPTASCVLTILWQCSHILVSWLYSYFVHIFLCPHCALCSHLPVSSLCSVFTFSCAPTVLCVHILMCPHCALCSHFPVSSLYSVFTSSRVSIVFCVPSYALIMLWRYSHLHFSFVLTVLWQCSDIYLCNSVQTLVFSTSPHVL